MPNYHETIQDGARHKRNYLGLRYRHEKPVCRQSFLKTNQESCKWLIFSKQRHRMLISSPLLPSQKESETNPSREQKDTAVFANRSWSKITITSLAEVTTVNKTNVRHERKNGWSECYKEVLYAASKWVQNIWQN